MASRCRAQVSVIIPVFNCEAYLGEAIDSVLSQTYSPAEVIVVDDGSTDGSRDVAAGYSDHIQYIYQENLGIGAARCYVLPTRAVRLHAPRWQHNRLRKPLAVLCSSR